MSDTRSLDKWMITLTVMLVAVIEVLDMTIVNVSLPAMMGSLGANSEQITWVLTSYIVSAAIFMPLTGFLTDRFGQKKLLICNILGFFMASILCGIATSLEQIILFRTLQGIFGASLVPMSQFILRDTFPKSQHGQAMAIWGIGIMAGPVFGPTLGGYITASLSWRWVFYINVPICLLAFFLAIRYIKPTPIKKKSIDYLGMLLMIIGIGGLQVFLDRGNNQDWLQSQTMVFLGLLWVIALSLFVIRGVHQKNNIINLNLFKDKNFSISILLITLFTACLLGSISIQPIMLESIMAYPTKIAGMLMAPRAISSAIAMAIVARLIGRIPSRYLLLTGLFFSFVGSYDMTAFRLDSSMESIMLAGAIQGLGMGFFFVPLSTLAFSTLNKNQEAEASGIFSFGRSLGSSIGISILSTLISRETQVNWQELGSHLTSTNHPLWQWLQQHNWGLDSPQAIGLLEKSLYRHASMNAFVDSFHFIALSFVIMLPLVFMLEEKEQQVMVSAH